MCHCPDALMILVATMVDLRNDKIWLQKLQDKKTVPLTFEEGELLAKKHGCLLYHESSALTGEGLDKQELFKMLIQSTIVFKSLNNNQKKCILC
jgi:Ras-related C3 botulinum toxin substrate 1